jgi:hypothetical protein
MKYVIGGREFSSVDLQRRTVRQDHFMVAVFRRTGIDKISAIKDEDPKEFLMRLHQKLLASGLACEVLSAFLLPVKDGKPMENKEWRKNHAQETQEHLEGCDTEEDRLLINQLAFELMAGFFKQGLISLLNSMRRSTMDDPNESQTSESPRIEESSVMKPGSGQRSSESAQTSTTNVH